MTTPGLVQVHDFTLSVNWEIFINFLGSNFMQKDLTRITRHKLTENAGFNIRQSSITYLFYYDKWLEKYLYESGKMWLKCWQSIFTLNNVVQNQEGYPQLLTGYHSHIDINCVKSVQIRSFFWSVFSCIRTKYGDLMFKSPYSIQIRGNTDQKKLRIWTLFTQW